MAGLRRTGQDTQRPHPVERFGFFHLLGISSSQLSNSSEGWLNHQPVMKIGRDFLKDRLAHSCAIMGPDWPIAKTQMELISPTQSGLWELTLLAWGGP